MGYVKAQTSYRFSKQSHLKWEKDIIRQDRNLDSSIGNGSHEDLMRKVLRSSGLMEIACVTMI